MIQAAWQKGYGIGVFSAHNAKTIQTILQVAQREQAPSSQKVNSAIGLEP